MHKRINKLTQKLINSPRFYRFLEMLPGILSLGFICLPLVLALFNPMWAAYFILLYMVYWTYNSIKFVVYAFIAHKKVLTVKSIDWLEKLKNDYPGEWNKFYYVALIPFASESINVLRPTVQSIVDNNWPKERKILCLSSEKAIPKGKQVAEELRDIYKDEFAYIFITEHELKEGELKGKSANQNHAARFLYDELTKLSFEPKYVLLTSNDADVRNDKEYIPYLIYKFLSEGDDRYFRIFQPIPTDYSDFWDAKFFSRLIVSIGANWRLALQQRDNYRCTVYSFYSMSLYTLKEIGFWDVDLIPEDERTMFKALFRFGEKFKVVPLFINTYGNPVQSDSFWKAAKEQYIQVRRWAWGASEFAYSFTHALKNTHVSWRVKLLPIFNQLRTVVEWSSSSILPLLGGYIPGLFSEEFRLTTLNYYLGSTIVLLIHLASLLVLMIVYIEYQLIPKNDKTKGMTRLLKYVHWILMPYVGLIFSSIPALDAQIRLLLNRRIVYVESKKEK